MLSHAQCNDANCGRPWTKVFARAICGWRSSQGSGFQLRVFSDWWTRARFSTWPVAHSKFGSCQWALPGNETFTAYRKLPLATHARTQALPTVRLHLSFFSAHSILPPSTPQLLFHSFFLPASAKAHLQHVRSATWLLQFRIQLLNLAAAKFAMREGSGFNSHFLYVLQIVA